jgi:DNA-binding NarL/FixJ family response regulator
MESSTSKIVIVEDNDVVRDGFTLLISSLSEHEVIAAYESCEEAIKNLEKDNPDLVLMDIELPGMNGIEGTRCFRLYY